MADVSWRAPRTDAAAGAPPRKVTPSPEEIALVACVRAGVNPEVARNIPELANVTDWNLLRRRADEHGVTCVAAHAIRHTTTVEIDSAVRRDWQQLWREQTTHNLQLSAALVRVLDVMATAHIPVLPFRGPVLAAALYGDRSLRHSRDLDILVRPCDVERLTRLLLSKGYETDLPLDPQVRTAYLKARYELHFAPPGAGFHIEVHQSFLARFQRFALDDESLWGRLLAQRWYGREIQVLAPEDLLLLLSAHGAKHMWSRLGFETSICV